MDRRSFIAGGAILTAAGAGVGVMQMDKAKAPPAAALTSQVIAAPEVPMVMTPIAVGSTELHQHVGKRLLLKGWVRKAKRGPGHYFIFTEAENGADDRRAVRVYPADARRVSEGYAQMEGRYFEGKFVDLPTGEMAFAALTDAV